MREIDAIFTGVFQLERHLVRTAQTGSQAILSTKIDSLPIEFERYIENLNEDELDKNRLHEIGIKYLNSVIA